MTAPQRITEALAEFGYPVAEGYYTGSEDHYFVFNYADEYGADFGDDTPECTVAAMQVHFFLPRDEAYQTIKRSIREALFSAGFTYPAITNFTVKETNTRHIVYECEVDEERT